LLYVTTVARILRWPLDFCKIVHVCHKPVFLNKNTQRKSKLKIPVTSTRNSNHGSLWQCTDYTKEATGTPSHWPNCVVMRTFIGESKYWHLGKEQLACNVFVGW